MKITKIHTLKDGSPVSSLDKSEIINIGAIKDGVDGKIQFITVRDKDDVTLKVLIKDSRFFLDPNEYDGSGWSVSFMAGPPVNSIPVGIEYMNDGEKQRIIVTGKAGKMVISHSSDVEVQPIQPSIPTESQSTEKSFITNTSIVNSSPKPIAVKKSGAHDDKIVAYVKERIYLFDIVRQAVIDAGSNYPMEKITELATSVHIEAARAGIKLTPPTESKPRINEAYTNGHNPPTPVAPEQTKTAAKPVETKVETVETKPPAKASEIGAIKDYICGAATEAWYHIEDAKGNSIGVVAQDDVRRAKVLYWFMSNSYDSVQKDPATKDIWSAIKQMIDNAPRHFQREMLFESMRYDQSIIEDLDYSESNFERFDANIVAIVNRRNDQAINDGKTNPFVISKAYYDVDPDDRVA